MSTINKTAHGLSEGQAIRFGTIVPTDTGIDETATYYVIASGLTADAFKFSETPGGAEFTLLADITDGDIFNVEEYQPLDPEEEPDTEFGWASVRDIEAPSIPSGLATTPAVNGMFVKWSQTTANDLAFFELRYAPDIGTGLAPDTNNWTTIRTKATGAFIGNLPADTNADGLPDSRYWFQVRAVDTTGNVAPWQADNFTASAATNVLTMPSVHQFIAGDRVRFSALVGGTGLTEGTDYYVIAGGLTTTAFKVSTTVGGAEVDITVDYTSGSVDGYPVYRDYQQEPDTGWCIAVSGDPALVGSSTIQYQSIGTEHVKVTGLSADIIMAGTLDIDTNDANMTDGIKVYDDGVLIGLWNETGLYVYDAVDPLDYIRLFDGGLSIFADGVEIAALTPDGVSASALTFGSLPGGHNVILNSGFELAAFGTGPAEATWDVQADFDGTDVSVTNLTHNAGNITATTLAY